MSDSYRQKYIRYKTLYLKLKANLSGGGDVRDSKEILDLIRKDKERLCAKLQNVLADELGLSEEEKNIYTGDRSGVSSQKWKLAFDVVSGVNGRNGGMGTLVDVLISS